MKFTVVILLPLLWFAVPMPKAAIAIVATHVPFVASTTALQQQVEESSSTATWQSITLPTNVTTATINMLAVHPLHAASLYLATQSGLYHSQDAGTSWRRSSHLADNPIFEVVQAEANPQRLYIRSWQTYRSDDGGITWQELTPPEHTCGFVIAPSQPDRLYARRCAPSALPPVVRSDDGGHSWIIPTNAITETFDIIAITPDQPDIIIATNFDQTWRSIDGGQHWTQAAIGVRYFGRPLFDRENPATLYLGHWTGLLRSQDTGVTWEDSNSAREFSTLALLPREAGVLMGGNQEATWRFQADSERWQAAAWQAPAKIEQLWSSANDPQILYARNNDGLWRLDLRTTRTFTPTHSLFLPFVQKSVNTAIAANSSESKVAVQHSAQHIVEMDATETLSNSSSEQAVARANHYRALAGVAPFQSHPAIATAAAGHINYRLLNYADSSAWTYGAHGQVEGKPGFTGQWPKDRIAAAGYPWWGGAEVMHGLGNPISSVDDWVATVYHRFAILDPYNHYAGYAHHTGAPVAVDVMDFGSGPTGEGVWMPATPYPLAYPADGQTNVPTSWSGAESPSPLPPGAQGPVGYPFTLQGVGGGVTITQAELRTEAGELVPTHPNPPDCASGSCLALMAVTPLMPHTTYVVTAAGDVSGVAFQRKWRFTTGADTPTVTGSTIPSTPP